MDNAKQHWKILHELKKDLAKRVRMFLVIWGGRGVVVATEDGQGFLLETEKEPTLLDVPELVQMAQGERHILLLNKRGNIYAFGQNNYGQLGLGTADEETHFTPQLISIPHKFTSVRCGGGHSLALTEDGNVWAWGLNEYCQVDLGLGYFIPSPCKISKLDSHRIVAIECGGRHSLALTDQGEVYGWGWNRFRQLGDMSGLREIPPTRIPIPSPIKSMAAGSDHTLLLTRTGEVYACGSNENCQLGFPTTTNCSASLCEITDFPTTTNCSANLCKVAGLPYISQIASHPVFNYGTGLSIAISPHQRCFIWGQLHNKTPISTPQKMSPDYSTVDSPLSILLRYPNTPHSVPIPETPPSGLFVKMSRIFDNPETSDVQFVVEQRTIHAHQILLRNSSNYFAQMFSKRWLAPVDPKDPIFKVTISDHSYQVFHAFLRFLYTECLEVHSDLLPELFELASLYLVPDLLQTCLSRMRYTLSVNNFCIYYTLINRHSLPELEDFQDDLVRFASTQMSEIAATAAYQSMESKLRDNLTNEVQNLFDPASIPQVATQSFK